MNIFETTETSGEDPTTKFKGKGLHQDQLYEFPHT